MAKFWKLFTAFIICFSLFGCGQQQKPLHLVTKISVTDNNGITRNFTDPQKMETILYYLRSLDPMGRP